MISGTFSFKGSDKINNLCSKTQIILKAMLCLSEYCHENVLYYYWQNWGGWQRHRQCQHDRQICNTFISLSASCQSGHSCSKLMALLADETLNCQTYCTPKHCHFLLKNVTSFCTAKAPLILSTKHCILGFICTRRHNESFSNGLIKLTIPWTTRPWRGTDILLREITLTKKYVFSSISQEYSFLEISEIKRINDGFEVETRKS